MTDFITKQLIFDYFAGNVTALQRKLIDEWSQDPVHEARFYKWLEEWERAHLQYVADQQSALDRYHDFLYNSRPADTVPAVEKEQPFPAIVRRNWLMWAMAASVSIIIGLWAFQEKLLTQSYTTAFGQTRTITLSDGSQVTLNANSCLRIPRFGFGSQTREVRLAGEALFSVTHTAANQRFVVKTDNGADVVVLGTEFSLFARPRGVKVVLYRGKVQIQYHQADKTVKQVTMRPGDLITLNKNGEAQLKPVTRPTDYSAWRNHRYVFDKTSLKELTYMFRENFGITLTISDPETAALSLSGAYPAQTADELLAIIAEALALQITRQGNVLLLSPKPI